MVQQSKLFKMLIPKPNMTLALLISILMRIDFFLPDSFTNIVAITRGNFNEPLLFTLFICLQDNKTMEF